MQNAITIQINKDDNSFIDLINTEKDLEFAKLETSSFDGQSEVITLVITLTPMILTFLGKIISDQIKSKKYVKVIYKGIQIQGISEKNVSNIINEIIENEKK